MAALFTEETVKKAMEQCNWERNHRFVPASSLKPRVLEKALSNIAPQIRKEDVVAFRDDSLLHNAKSGWILTADHIYFHNHYRLSSDPNHKHFIDFSQVKKISHLTDDNRVSLHYQDDTTDTLDCSIGHYGNQIYEFLACIMQMYNAGYYDDTGFKKDIKELTHSLSFSFMKTVFGKYPSFTPVSDIPEKKLVLLKKHLQNPFLEQIVAFGGTIDKSTAYGHLFTSDHYYFLSAGHVADHISLWELVDIYPHHSDHEMTAIMKDETVRPLNVGRGISKHDELEAILQEIAVRQRRDDPRGQHLKESPEEEARRTRIYRKIFQIQDRSIERPYANMGIRDMLPQCRKLEASGETEELPFLYEKIAYHSSPPDDSYFSVKFWLHMPLSRFSLSFAYYYLYCLKHNLRFCDDKVRRYEDLDYRAFIKMCNTTPLEQVRKQLWGELSAYRSRWQSE